MTTGLLMTGAPRNHDALSDFVRISYRDVSVLAPRPVDPLVPRLRDALDDHASRFRWIDHVVDHCPARREVRVDLGADRLDELRSSRLGVVRCLDLLVVDDVHGAIGAIDWSIVVVAGSVTVALQ